jgi:hypothetical protein
MRVIVRRTAELPPGVGEGYAQLKPAWTAVMFLRLAGYGLGGLIVLFILRKFVSVISNAARPR